MALRHLRKGERVEFGLPVWIGGTYVAFLGSLVVAIAVAAALSPTVGGGGLVFVALAAAAGALAGRWLAQRRSAGHPIRSQALQVFVGLTDRRLLVYEPRSWGKPGRLLAEYPRSAITAASFSRGGLIRPSRLELVIAGHPHLYEFSGWWDVTAFVEAVQLAGR